MRAKIIKLDGRSVNRSVYPGQTEIIPDNAKEITILPLGSVFGDEEIKVTIIEADGKKKTVKNFGKTVKLGEKEEKNENAVIPKVTNSSNVSVGIVFQRKNGKPSTPKKLNNNQTFSLPNDVEWVQVVPDGRVWGDEKIEIKVTMLDDSAETISRFGGIIKFIKEERKTVPAV